MADLLDELKRRQHGGDLIDEAIASEPQVEPNELDAFSSRVGDVLNRSLGLPVDVVTKVINEASQLAVGRNLIDPSKAIGGSQSVREFGQGASLGLSNVGRGLGLIPPETEEERQSRESLVESSPSAFAGELVGEVAPFVAPATAIGRIPSLTGRALGTGGLAATEAGLIAKGRGGTGEEVQKSAQIAGGLGVALEVAFPVFGSVANSLYRRVTGKTPKGELIKPDLTPTREFEIVLERADLTPEDFTSEALTMVRGGADPIQTERSTRFARQQIPTTKGVITQDDVILGREETILGRTDEAGEMLARPLRERRQAQSDAFIRYAENLADDLGVSDAAGLSIKNALTQKKKLLNREKNELYKQVADLDPSLANAPIVTDTIVDAIPEDKVFRRIGRIKGNQSQALSDLLVEFGIDQSPAKLEKYLKGGNTVEPLSFGNFEDFRQGLNQLVRADESGATFALAKPILDKLDGEISIAANAMGNASAEALDTVERARSKVRELKVEFDPKDTVDKMVSFRKGGNVPTLESSKIVNTIVSPSTSKEATERVVNSLHTAGKEGVRALGDLQAAVVMRALDNAISATSNKSGGRQMFSPNAFVRELNKIDVDGKIGIIFRGNSASLKELNDLRRSASDVIVPSSTKPKGSSPAVNAILGVFGAAKSVPVIKQVNDMVVEGARAGASLDVTPQQQQAIEYVRRDFPSLAAVLAGAFAIREVENNDQ